MMKIPLKKRKVINQKKEDDIVPHILEATKSWLDMGQFPKVSAFEQFLKKNWYPGKKIGGAEEYILREENERAKQEKRNTEIERYEDEIKKLKKQHKYLDDRPDLRSRTIQELNELAKEHKNKKIEEESSDEITISFGPPEEIDKDDIPDPDPDNDYMFNPETYYTKLKYKKKKYGKPDYENDIKIIGNVSRENDNKLFVQNYTTKYERTSGGGNCVVISFFQFVKAARVDFDTFYNNLIIDYINLPAEQHYKLVVGEKLHVIRVLWDGILNGQFKSYRAIAHLQTYANEDNWKNHANEKINPRQFFEISSIYNSPYNIIESFLDILFFVITGIDEDYFDSRNIPGDKKQREQFDKYLSFISKYTRTIPFITYSIGVQNKEDGKKITKKYKPKHVFCKIYDVDKDKVYDLNSNLPNMKVRDKWGSKDFLTYHEFTYLEFNHELKDYEVKEDRIQGFTPLPIDKTKLSPLLKEYKNKQLDKSYITC